jgi:murein tripeptide amidase MpaA
VAKKPPSGGGCVGVDINRNFDFLWDHLAKFASDSGVSASDDPCNPNIYRGPSPASEPETRNVIWLLDSYPQIRWHVDVHSAVPVILHSWGSDQNQSAQTSQNFLNCAFDQVRGRANDTAYGEYISRGDMDIVTSVSLRMDNAIAEVRGDSYGVEQAFGLYPTSGASDDYAFCRNFADNARTKVYGFTIECGHSFQPTWAEAEEVIREVSAGLIAFCLAAAEHSTQRRRVSRAVRDRR